MKTAPAINSIANYFGGNRTHAGRVGELLGTLSWCAVPFCGGCSEIQHIDTRAGIASDLHRHVINLARVIKDPALNADLSGRLANTIFHEDELVDAQRRCSHRDGAVPVDGPDVEWAHDYFITSWMRGSGAGKRYEFSGRLSARYSSEGGDSSRRFRSAADSLEAWCRIFDRWSFLVEPANTIIEKIRDQEDHGLYIDAPWPDAGKEYRHSFTDNDQHELANSLRRFMKARVVVRYGDHPLIRELYPETEWEWFTHQSRSQRNSSVNEVLIRKRTEGVL